MDQQERAQVQVDMAEEDLQAARRTGDEQKIREAKEEVKEAKEEVKEAKEDVKEAEEKVKEAKEEVKEAKEEVKEAKEDVKEAEEKVKEAKEEVKEAKDEVQEKAAMFMCVFATSQICYLWLSHGIYQCVTCVDVFPLALQPAIGVEVT